MALSVDSLRYERSLLRAARTDRAEYENVALRIKKRSLRVDLQAIEREHMKLLGEWRMATGEQQPRQPIRNVVCITVAFNLRELVGPPAVRRLVPWVGRGVLTRTLPTTAAR